MHIWALNFHSVYRLFPKLATLFRRHPPLERQKPSAFSAEGSLGKCTYLPQPQPGVPVWQLSPAQAMADWPGVSSTLYCTGMETQTCWVITTSQEVPAASVVQVTAGMPWQVAVGVPMEVLGLRVTGALMSTHWTTVRSQPLAGQEGALSIPRDAMAVCS